MDPITYIGTYIIRNSSLLANKIGVDLGCGEGRLYEYLNAKRKDLVKNFRCFDLQKTKPFIEVCDISNLKMDSESIDFVVFCLSLMGTNFGQFLKEASRVLNLQGTCIILEVSTRLTNKEKLLENLNQLGFTLKEEKDL